MSAAKPTKGIQLPTPAERRAEFRRSLPDAVTTDEQALEVARLLDSEAITETLEDKLARLSGGRRPGAKNDGTPKIERDFDKMYRANHALSSEDARLMKAPPKYRKYSRSRFAKHWKEAKERAKTAS